MEIVRKSNPAVEDAVKQVSQNVRVNAELFKRGVAKKLAGQANFTGSDIAKLWLILQKQNEAALKEMYRKLSAEIRRQAGSEKIPDGSGGEAIARGIIHREF
jgi:hypothetical protein